MGSAASACSVPPLWLTGSPSSYDLGTHAPKCSVTPWRYAISPRGTYRQRRPNAHYRVAWSVSFEVVVWRSELDRDEDFGHGPQLWIVAAHKLDLHRGDAGLRICERLGKCRILRSELARPRYLVSCSRRFAARQEKRERRVVVAAAWAAVIRNPLSQVPRLPDVHRPTALEEEVNTWLLREPRIVLQPARRWSGH